MLTLSVCIGSSCHLKGSYNVIQVFQHLIEENHLHEKINLKATFCMKDCGSQDISVSVNEEIFKVSVEKASEFFLSIILPRLQ